MLAALFFLSGCCALVYEVTWARQLGLVLGNTQEASAAVVAVFLAGLALGSVLGVRLAARSGNCLRTYALAELAAAFFALAISQGYNLLLQGGLVGPSPAGRALACAILLLTTVPLGTSLPLILRASSPAVPAAVLGRLYAANTAGAVAGCLIPAFIGFPYFGLTETVAAAAALNAAVGLVAFVLSQKLPAAGISPAADADLPGSKVAPGQTATDEGRGAPALIAVFAFVSGFTSLSYEMLWLRMLRPVTSSSTYTFTLIVACFLLGLALGALIYSKAAAKSGGRLLVWLLIWAQFLSAVLAELLLVCLPLIRPAASPIAFLFGLFVFERGASLLATSLITVACVLPASIAVGCAFPALCGLFMQARADLSRAVGLVYAANTAGSIAGALAMALLIIPALGTEKALDAVALTSSAAGLGALCLCRGIRPTLKCTVALAFLSLVAVLVLMPADRFARSFPVSPGGAVLGFAEDASSAVMAVDYGSFRKLIVNGEPYSSTAMNGLRYMRLLGHLPLLIARGREDVLVVCFGTGTTAGAVACHADVRSLDIVDLSPAVIGMAKFFSATNRSVLADGRVRVVIDDGRHFLAATDKQYDVVSFEPPPPCDAGVVNLYTSEFYQLVRRRLKPGGIMCQWVPMALESGQLWKMMVQSARVVFPHVSVWVPNNREALLVASMAKPAVDWRKVDEGLRRSPKVKSSLAEVGFPDSWSVIATYAAGADRLASFVGDTKPLTDNRPALEFFLPYGDDLVYPDDLAAGEPGLAVEGASEDERERLAASRKAMRLVWAASKLLAREGDIEAARAMVGQAADLEPDNQYWRFALRHPKAGL